MLFILSILTCLALPCIYQAKHALKRTDPVLRRHLRQDIKRACAHRAELANHDPAGRRRQAVPVAVEDSILEEADRRFCLNISALLRGYKHNCIGGLTVAHLGKGADVARQADAVEGRETTVPMTDPSA
jgi:hypothetical protein